METEGVPLGGGDVHFVQWKHHLYNGWPWELNYIHYGDAFSNGLDLLRLMHRFSHRWFHHWGGRSDYGCFSRHIFWGKSKFIFGERDWLVVSSLVSSFMTLMILLWLAESACRVGFLVQFWLVNSPVQSFHLLIGKFGQYYSPLRLYQNLNPPILWWSLYVRSSYLPLTLW